MIKPLKRLLPAGLLVLALAACGSIVELPNSGDAPSLYNLTALDSPQGTGTDKMLMIEDPTAIGGLDERYIARRPSPNELQYFGGVRWHTRASNMVQATLAESFEKVGQPVSIGRGGAVVPPKYELQIDIRDFQAEYYSGNTPDIHIRLSVDLVQMVPLKIVGTREFDISRRADNATMTAIIDGFDRANRAAQAAIIDWALPLMTTDQ